MKNKLSFELLADDIAELIKMRLRDIEVDAEPIIQKESVLHRKEFGNLLCS